MPSRIAAAPVAPELKLHNTLTREKEVFRPLDPNNVRIYVCGPTVYDFAHIGNARPAIVFDVLFRLLRHLYGSERVTYVRNITDVDDKINKRAADDYPDLPLNEAIRRLTERTEAQFQEDVRALGCLDPTVQPRATEHIAEMRSLIERLIARGHAYVAEDHVLFDVSSMPDYGRLSRRSLDELVAGARVEVAPYKRGPMDFVLWKPSKQAARSAGGATGTRDNREPAWPSPAGIAVQGRPGWHLECSAMADKWLWEEARRSLSEPGLAHPHEFDIHGGGIDLVFPHHENEIAQTRCGFGAPAMAQIWMHNGFLQVEGEKMSKSLGNFVTIRELLNDWPGDVIRLAMLSTHYRQPMNWTLRGLEDAAKIMASWFDAAADAAEPQPAPAVLEALADDLNTPKAIAEMHGLRGRAGHKSLGGTLAFFGFRPDLFASWWAATAPAPALPPAEIDARIAARRVARRARDFATADRIRDELAALGIALKDGKDPATGEPVTTWEVVR